MSARSPITTEMQGAMQPPPDKGTAEWDELIALITAQIGHPICGAKKTSAGPHKGYPCERAKMPNGRCHKHGGKNAPPGINHPQFKTGRYSKLLKGKSLAQAYEEALSDPHLLSLHEEIAVLVARQRELFDKAVNTGESKHAWRAVARVTTLLRKTLNDRKNELPLADRLAPHLDTLQNLVGNGQTDYAMWTEYDANASQLRQLIDTERKYSEEMRISPDRLELMLLIISDAIGRVVPEDIQKRLDLEIDVLRRGTGGNDPRNKRLAN